MRERNQTTVVLTKIAQEVKDELTPIYGLKNILSAGLLLFSRLDAEAQRDIITEVHNLKTDKKTQKGVKL